MQAGRSMSSLEGFAPFLHQVNNDGVHPSPMLDSFIKLSVLQGTRVLFRKLYSRGKPVNRAAQQGGLGVGCKIPRRVIRDGINGGSGFWAPVLSLNALAFW